jgi:CheY-like chemotaxis protein
VLVSGRKMLLADDSITIQKVVDLTFADEGMQVTTVSNGEQAIEKLEEVAPDIVLADVFMPGRSGYEVCEHIKQNERFRHIPVMLLVGSFEPFDEAEARRVGADDFLTKPFQSIRQLVNKVSALLSGSDDEATTRDLKLPAGLSRAEEQTGAKPTELSMADTAPLPSQTQGESAASEEREAAGHASFDDEMIEAAPASSFTTASSSPDAVRQAQPTAPLLAEEFEEMRINHADESSSSQLRETMRDFNFEELKNEAAAPSQPAPAAPYMARAAAADEALLDLGELETPAAAAAADEFILDLQDEPSLPPAQVAPLLETMAPPADELSEETLFQEEAVETAPQVEEFAEAQAVAEGQRAESAAVEEAEPQVAETQGAPLSETQGAFTPESPMAATMASELAPGGREEPVATGSPATNASQITLEQLSPEVIESIARRAVEHLSERVVQEIAWEVVPQLAELLIKRQLEKNSSQ